jgi:hypothetical protein
MWLPQEVITQVGRVATIDVPPAVCAVELHRLFGFGRIGH